MQTNKHQWEKLKLLGDNHLMDPIDEWRIGEMHYPATGQKYKYCANYATGQMSWLSEEDAAHLLQRRYQ